MENGQKSATTTVVATEKPKLSYTYMGKIYDDGDMVAYYKHENFIYKIENKLIGDFDNNGRYTIDNVVLKDLVALRKQIVKKDKQFYFLKAVCGKEVFEFKLEFGTVSKTEFFAQLYLIEKAARIAGDEKIEISTPIVFYTDDADAYFETKVKKIFNILQDGDDEGRMKENETIALNLLEKIRIFSKAYERYLQESKLKDKIYIEKLLRILSQDANFGSIILKKYEELIKRYSGSLNPANNNYYRILKQLLDSILVEEEKNVSREVALLVQRLRKVYTQANQETIELISAVEKKVEVKKETAKEKSSSGGGGSSSSKSRAAKAAPKKVETKAKPFSSAVLLPQKSNETQTRTSDINKQAKQVDDKINSFFVDNSFMMKLGGFRGEAKKETKEETKEETKKPLSKQNEENTFIK